MEKYPLDGWNAMTCHQHLENAFDEFIHLIGFYNDHMTLIKLDFVFNDCFEYEYINLDKVDSDINMIREERDVTIKALTMFCYVSKLAYPAKGYLTLAFVMANKILIEHLVGYLIIPDNNIPMFVSMVEDYMKSDNPAPVMEFLRRCIIYE